MQVHGQSMGEALRDGSDVRILVAKPPALPGCAEGDVALFWSPEREQLVAHRVVQRGSNFHGEPYVITRGDGCVLCDAPLNLDEVIGTVVQVRKEDSWEPVPPPARLPLWKRGLAGMGVWVAGCWAFCSTPPWRRRLTLVMWRLRGNPVTP